ncbi:MAG: S41 family peptidase [Rikenellaceae bacterium]
MKIRNVLFVAISLLFISLTTSSKNGDDFKAGKNLEIFFNVFKGVNIMYVDSVNNDVIVRKALDAMLEGLDPYTEYFSEKDMDGFKFATTGKYGGVGALIRKRDNDTYGIIESTYKGFPMDNAGVRGGDTIISIDGVDMKKAKVGDLSDKMKGTPNTIVKIKIKSLLTGETKEHNIRREVVKISPVEYSGFINDSIGYIAFSNFSQNGAAEVKAALENLKSTGKLRGLVIDLRDNGGGIIDEAVNIVGLFVPKGTTVVDTKGKINSNNKSYTTSSTPIEPTLPLAILINSSSASASEIVAGSLQDMDRAVILGGRSFGKGLVQATKEVGYGSMLKVTTAKYYIPSGRCIQALDYSHRNEDGSVGNVPDSLISEFKTLKGRKVYDGGGIMPDIVMEPDFISIFVASIYARGYFDDYSIDYYKTHRQAPAIDFKLSDAEYDKFCKYIADKDIEFSSKSEDNLTKLIESAKKEKIYASIEEDIKNIEAVLKHKDRQKSLLENKNAIKEMLESTIVGRYYYQVGRVEKVAKSDKTVLKAVEVLSNNKEYENILTNVSTSKK